MFARYIALGDSMSIDLYAALDSAGINRMPSWEELTRLRPGLGAASLTFRNDDSVWPQFAGRDLATLFPGIAFRNHDRFDEPPEASTDNFATDGATLDHVLLEQLPRVEPSEEPVVVTLTAGGNDILLMLDDPAPPRDYADILIDSFHRVVAAIASRLPRATLIAGTVYDPSDGSFELEGRKYERPAEWLAAFNDDVRSAPERHRDSLRLAVADIHEHFFGHGLSAGEEERWYWRGLVFEPNARGASEIRALFLDALARLQEDES